MFVDGLQIIYFNLNQRRSNLNHNFKLFPFVHVRDQLTLHSLYLLNPVRFTYGQPNPTIVYGIRERNQSLG